MSNPNPRNKPWRHSTGPRTPKGKARSSQNSVTTGLRSGPVNRVKELERVFRKTQSLEDFEKMEEARVAAVRHVLKVADLKDGKIKMRVAQWIQNQTRKSLAGRNTASRLLR